LDSIYPTRCIGRDTIVLVRAISIQTLIRHYSFIIFFLQNTDHFKVCKKIII